MVRTPPLWWYQNCAIALGVKLEEILDYEHVGWHRTPKAPTPPDANWLKEKAAAKGQTKPAQTRATSDKGPGVAPLLRKSGLAADD